MSEKLVIIGASGNVGGELARILRAQGHAVRTTSSRQANGSAGVHLDLVTAEGLDAAFADVERAFLMSPAGHADQYAILAPQIEAARRHGLKKVVLLSAFGADADPGTPLRRAELALEQSGLAYNIIRPNWFMQNFHSFWLHGILSANEIALPAGDARTSFIDTRDIAAVAAQLLFDARWNDRAFNLTGPEALTHAQAAKAIAEASGRPVTYRDIGPEELRASLLPVLGPAYTALLVLLFGYLKAGYNAAVTDDVQRILGRAPRSFLDYVAEHKAVWA